MLVLAARSKTVMRATTRQSSSILTVFSDSSSRACAFSTSKATNTRGLKPSWNYKALAENAAYHRSNIKARKSDADIDRILELNKRRVNLQKRITEIQHERNLKISAVGQDQRDRARALKDSEKELAVEAVDVDEQLLEESLKLPNITHRNVPEGPEECASLLCVHGAPLSYDFQVKDHIALGLGLDIFDFQTAAEISGTKFVYLKNEAALLEQALVMWALNKLRSKGWQIIFPPDLVRRQIVEGCGFQPRGNEATQTYEIKNSDLCLAATSEISIAGLGAARMFQSDELPLKVAAFSHCFRTEAGSGGKPGKGLFRLHQFSKVEMFSFCHPDESSSIHREILDIQVELYSELGLHFKVLDMPTEELGASAFRKYDIEAWMPGRQSFGEISSASNCTDYQARRLGMRFRPKAGSRPEFVHTVNGTAVAIPRLLVAIMETFQHKDGSVSIPEVLRSYMGNIATVSPSLKAVS